MFVASRRTITLNFFSKFIVSRHAFAFSSGVPLLSTFSYARLFVDATNGETNQKILN